MCIGYERYRVIKPVVTERNDTFLVTTEDLTKPFKNYVLRPCLGIIVTYCVANVPSVRIIRFSLALLCRIYLTSIAYDFIRQCNIIIIYYARESFRIIIAGVMIYESSCSHRRTANLGMISIL